MANEPVDVAIVGSGAAGSLMAAKLAETGRTIAILEAGPERSAGDLISSQIWARRLKWSGPAIETGGSDPLSVGFGSGWGTGGSAMHHYACWMRLHAEDFDMRSRFGRGLDWPLSYEQLRPYYDRIQHEVGISGDASQEIWRPAGEPYPMPPLSQFGQGRLIAQGFKQLGGHTAPLPMAINSVPYNGRPACIYDGWCDAGCPIGALANPLTIYLPQALRGGATLRHRCAVRRVLTNAIGDRAEGLEFFDAQGERQVQEARVVILAAFAYEIPRILLNSKDGGLANTSGQVGRFMMSHSTSNIYGLFREPTDNHMGMTGGQLISQDDYAKDPDKGHLASAQWLIGNALKPNDLLGIANSRPELFGEALHQFIRTASRNLATMTFVGEDLPDPDNRLVLSSRKDAYGFPLASVTHSFGPDSLRCWEAGLARGKAIFDAAGAYEVWVGSRAQMHTLGGAIMGVSPQTSVTNSYGQTHDISNLFVAGSSLFPTCGAVNPTYTIHALALRAAEYIVQQWSSLASG